MRHKNSPATINMQTKTSPKPARRSRTRLRKPKFLSLRLQISPPHPETTAFSAGMSHGDRHRRKQSSRAQINHFPETDLEDIDQENLAADFLFNGDDTTVTTLNGLLDGGSDTAAEMAYSPVDSVGSRADSVSTQLREAIEYGDRRRRRQSSLLLRAAMKGGGLRETEHGEEIVEKWVSYSEVVERKLHEDEVSSCTAASDSSGVRPLRMEEVGPLVRLKLDYEEVLHSWSNKGSLFIHGEGFSDDCNPYQELPPPQCVPALSGESILRDTTISEEMNDGLGSSVNNMWAVPEDEKTDIITTTTSMSKMGEKEQDWYRQREASVMRYKEKRQNRLFDKRIRYQVRKLNAEKRPRIKGRFVRRS